MKKKKIASLQTARSLQERVELLRDEWQGTQFDSLFKSVKLAKEMKTLGHPGVTMQLHCEIGEYFSEIISTRNSQILYDIAKATAALKRHKPKPDYDLIVLFSLAGLFPPGWEKKWRCGNDKKGRPLFGVRPGTRLTIAMRDIKKNLQKDDPNFSEDEWETRKRRIKRLARKFEISLDHSPGRPTR